MPFGGNFDAYYKEIIAPAVREARLSPVRADEIYGTRAIIDDIFDQIRSSRLVVADVTGRNPNVNYELGLAHAMQKPVVIISGSISDVPFDLKHLRVILYDTRQVNWAYNLRIAITQTCSTVLDETGGVNSFLTQAQDSRQVRSFLSRMQNAFDYTISKESIIESDERCNSSIRQNWTIHAKSDVTHVYHKIILDAPEKIRLEKIFDPLNGVDLDYFPEDAGDCHLNYYILFQYALRAGTIGTIELHYSVDGYLAKLLNESRAVIFHQSMLGGRSRFSTKRETYTFPNVARFKNLRGLIVNHPDRSKIGLLLKSRPKGDKRILTADFDSAGFPDGSFGIELAI